MASTGRENITHIESIRRLFQAFRDGNDSAFHKLAQSIITDQLAANHHSVAKAMQAALGKPNKDSAKTSGKILGTLRKKEHHQFLTIYHEPCSTEHLLLEDSVRSRVDRFIDERNNANKLASYGLAPKSKLLFWGPPGCGKTLTAHYLANQFNLKVGVVRLSSLISSYLGDTAAHIQQVFEEAQNEPMVLLFDEIDSIAKTRDDSRDVGELKRVVNSLLQSMDTFVAKESILIGASNHQYLLDPAIWRRFDDVLLFPKPSSKTRKEYLRKQMNGVAYKGSIEGPVYKCS
ncbi:ATP-binding protein [Planctomycetaceae bacterium]|nr:ATP-binding protein [Planctomycetaceae bacterium]